MMINIIFRGKLRNIIVKRRTERFFREIKHVKRNDVFIDVQSENIFHIKKNSICILLNSSEKSDLLEIKKYLKFLFDKKVIGIRASESIYNELKDSSFLELIRI